LFEKQKPTFHIVKHVGNRMGGACSGRGGGKNDKRRRNVILTK
jgi:hypothetical protein